MPKLKIDEKEIEVPKGTRVIEAAKRLGIEIPFYCYHPGLSVAGNCRMCLVEVEKMPRLQIACHLEAQEGMAVKTNTPRIIETRKHILEYLLVNHPLDCPVCDQAGECWLQDYYMKHGLYASRLDENKTKKPKAIPVGPTVMLDAERCILCSRCVRFTDEISKTRELGIINRGNHSEITVFPGKELDNRYSGNVVDICPVGALTDKDFRFKARVWYLESANSICHGCSRGCNIQIQYNLRRTHHAQGDRVVRIKPRFNGEVNRWWICDEGRYDYQFHDHNRIVQPLKRTGNSIHPMGWDDILGEIANLFRGRKGRIGVILSPQLSNEEIYLARKIFRDELKLKDILLVSPKPEGFQDDFLIRADKNPNTKGAELLGFRHDAKALTELFAAAARGEVEGLVVFGQDLLGGDVLRMSGRPGGSPLPTEKLKWSVFIGSNTNLMSEFATFVLPSATYAEKEGTLTNFEGKIQKFDRALIPFAEAKPEWEILTQLAKVVIGARRISAHCHPERSEGSEILQPFGLQDDTAYKSPEEVFNEMAATLEPFRGLSYEKLKTSGEDLEAMAAPTIPALQQDGNSL